MILSSVENWKSKQTNSVIDRNEMMLLHARSHRRASWAPGASFAPIQTQAAEVWRVIIQFANVEVAFVCLCASGLRDARAIMWRQWEAAVDLRGEESAVEVCVWRCYPPQSWMSQATMICMGQISSSFAWEKGGGWAGLYSRLVYDTFRASIHYVGVIELMHCSTTTLEEEGAVYWVKRCCLLS